MPAKSTSRSNDSPGSDLTEPLTTRTDTNNTDNTSSTLIEAPVKAGKNPLDQHEFSDGGGGGGAEAFRRRPR